MNARNRTMIVLTLAAVAMAAIVFTTVSATAATVTHLGNYLSYGDGWRSTGDPDKDGGGGVAGSDPDGDNAWGTDGYYIATLPASLPAYITSVTDTAAGTSTNLAVGYDDPSLAIAASVADRFPIFYSNDVSQSHTPVSFDITLAQAKTYVLTIIHDPTTNLPFYQTDSISVSGPGGAFAQTTGLIPASNGDVDYTFFLISGDPGDVFTANMVSGGVSGTISAGIGFEAIPEPSTFALSILGMLGLLACGRRRRR